MKMTMVNSSLKGLTPWGRWDESAKLYDTAIQTQNWKFGLMSNTLPHGHGTEPQERIFAILRRRKVVVSLKPEYRERENLRSSGTTSDIVVGGTTKTIKICISLYLYVAFRFHGNFHARHGDQLSLPWRSPGSMTFYWESFPNLWFAVSEGR